jgi:hypothetical protein
VAVTFATGKSGGGWDCSQALGLGTGVGLRVAAATGISVGVALTIAAIDGTEVAVGEATTRAGVGVTRGVGAGVTAATEGVGVTTGVVIKLPKRTTANSARPIISAPTKIAPAMRLRL